MTSLWSNTPPSAPDPPGSGVDTPSMAENSPTDAATRQPFASPNNQNAPPTSVPMSRPQIQRGALQPAPPQHQPPAPPQQVQQQSLGIGNPNDSLSLMQLRRIVTDFPRTDPASYAFNYTDTASYVEEVDEWFSYNEAEFTRLHRAKETFIRRQRKFSPSSKTWLQLDPVDRTRFIEREIGRLRDSNLRKRCKSLQSVLHIILGVWDETAGVEISKEDDLGINIGDVKTRATKGQLWHMKANLMLLTEAGGIPVLYELMQNAFKRLWDDEFRDTHMLEEDIPFIQDELDNVTTILYIIIEGVRNNPTELQAARNKFLQLEPSLIDQMLTITARLRWDEANELPQTRVFLLFWKSLLLVLGGVDDVSKVKKATGEFGARNDSKGKTLITASPLDYHIFRQEITSKYPAYIPPQPLLPLEPDNNSILPPLPNRPSRSNGSNGIIPAPIGVHTSGTSILNQPVHIATPAPSPPPSPPVGGKAGKKQNYQTNQNFPFMYPPLDSTSNTAGGKGAAGLQALLVGRKWEGSDVPKSILEAGELFAKRMRMTRAMRQLWTEREKFLKFDRGWENDDTDIDELNLDMDLEDILAQRLAQKLSLKEAKAKELAADYGPDGTIDKEAEDKLDLVENFYRNSLPHLQSLVIVLLKTILSNVTALITQPVGGQGQGGLAPGFRSEVNMRSNGVQSHSRPMDPSNIAPPTAIEPVELTIDELEAIRSREITSKAVSSILLSLCKWFKISHVLKFEYFTQLLLDSNYLPLVLKLFAHQELEKVVETRTDREELSFFAFCNTNSKHTVPVHAQGPPSDDSGDDAVPPPIKRNPDRALPIASASDTDQDQLPALSFSNSAVDDVEFNVNEVEEPSRMSATPPSPSTPPPITHFSWRNFAAAINLLRVMQKITKDKAHRNLLLVQYKSSNILKKSLKVPQPQLRMYTLKLFKGQVPYCGRKWRQGNMRVITAVYLYCRPELRDDWLAGSDIDAEVEEALPLEQALRALTHWANVRRFPDVMGADQRVLQEERDFFVRELERMDWGGGGGGGASAFGDDVEVNLEGMWDGGAGFGYN